MFTDANNGSCVDATSLPIGYAHMTSWVINEVNQRG